MLIYLSIQLELVLVCGLYVSCCGRIGFIARIKSKIGQKGHQVLYSYIGFAKEKKKRERVE